MRPSKLLTLIRSASVDPHLTIFANDEQGLLKLSGDSTAVAHAKTLISMFDVKPAKLEMKVEVASTSDRSGFEATVKVNNNQMWKATDSDTDVTVAIRPRIAEDGSVTVVVHVQSRGGVMESMIRLKPGKEATIVGASEATQQMFAFPRIGYVISQKVLPGPTIKVSLVK